jgi:glycosyltransferase involved in cell wall biosynthesis
MRVCHVTHSHQLYDQRVFGKECVSLRRAGHQVALIARGEDGMADGVVLRGIKLREIPTRSSISKLAQFAYVYTVMPARAARVAMKVKADVFHFHDLLLIPVGLLLRRRGAKVVFDSHEDFFVYAGELKWIPRPIRQALMFAARKLQELALPRFDGVIAAGPDLTEKLSAINPNCVTVTNYPRPEWAPPATTACADGSRPKDPAEFKIGFMGGIKPFYNLHVLLQAMEAIPETKLVLGGSGTDAYLDELKQLPAWDRVEYVGRVPHSEAIRLLAGCDAGVALLNYRDNMAGHAGVLRIVKPFEVMMLGLPLVMTDFEIYKPIVEGLGTGILVPPGDLNALTAALRQLVADRAEAKAMGERGAAAVRREYNWESQEAVLLEFYRALERRAAA